MKKGTFAAVLLVVCGYCFAADPAEGFWISIDDKTGKATAGWEIYSDGGLLYGKILSVVGYSQDAKAVHCKESYKDFPVPGKVNALPVVGTPWIFGLTMDKPGVWSGQVIDPDTGNIYKCKITYRPADGKKFKTNVLEMRGEIGLGIGRSQFWQKSVREEAAGLR